MFAALFCQAQDKTIAVRGFARKVLTNYSVMRWAVISDSTNEHALDFSGKAAKFLKAKVRLSRLR
jgi:hypothetical protein